MEEENSQRPTVQSSPFDAIRKVDEQGREYWNARDLGKLFNPQLAAKLSGVIKPEHFATFTDRGYQGLYDGETENMIHARKNLREDEHILDFMGSDELIANAFRASLTRQRLEREQAKDRGTANATHYQVGKRVRDLIIEQGGTVPEKLPTPEKSFSQF